MSELTYLERTALLMSHVTAGAIVEPHSVLRHSEHPRIKALMRLSDTVAEISHLTEMVADDLRKGTDLYPPEAVERWCDWLTDVDGRISDEADILYTRGQERNRDA